MIKQIIPCNRKMDAVLTTPEGTEERYPVLMFALFVDDDGLDEEIWPLIFDPEAGIGADCVPLHLYTSDPVRYEIEGR